VSCRITTPQPEGGPARGDRGRSLWGVTHDVTEAREERIRLQMRADARAQRRVIDLMHLAMFPREVPNLPGADLAAAYVAAPDRLDTGGDWYDFLPVDGGLIVAIGDVEGREHNATAVMGPVRAVLRAFAFEDADPGRILFRLNRFLIAGYDDDTYVTALVAFYEPPTRRLVVANAGHPSPLLLEPGRVLTLTEPGPALGILPEARFTTYELELEPGAALCVYRSVNP
jgi:serine phosphatase RsbU (regulator of sigma subunit)